ncbi:hypothetical protein FIBSPDRAFT_775369 [Athelia psychrophila]|uniref:G domain-containing protein n=1 Tax=Athelia psychrophila TaxID=1759441 RepID=A0A166URW1_9AGAM|nr:hypothetical protein FIBSPDRAFT_775369 [Fibularhizoctonia sp. CBS 109695]
MGLTGAGNSSFVNMALGRDACPVGKGQKPITVEIQAHRRGHPNGSGRNIVFIDTPGIGGRYKNAADVLWAMSGWLTDEYEGKNVLLTGILFMHRITDNRAPGGETAHMRPELLNALCKGSDLRNVVLVTTMCDKVEKATVTKRVDGLQSDFWEPMITHGSRVDSSYRHTSESAWEVLNKFEELEKQMGGRKSQGMWSSMFSKRKRGQAVPAKRAPGADVFIAVIGLMSTGKSSFVNMAVGKTSATIAEGLESGTDVIQEHRCAHPHDSGRSLVFIDTPGIGGKHKTAMDVLSAISRWLMNEYQGNVLLTGILFMHRITDNRVPSGETAHMRPELLNALCSGSDLRNVVLVTTMCDEVEEAIVTKRVAGLQSNFWEPMITHGSRVDSSYRHTSESAWDILNQFELHPLPAQNNQSQLAA